MAASSLFIGSIEGRVALLPKSVWVPSVPERLRWSRHQPIGLDGGQPFAAHGLRRAAGRQAGRLGAARTRTPISLTVISLIVMENPVVVSRSS